jgi:hypothetical protein
MEYHALPKELQRDSGQIFADGLYAAHFWTDDAESRSVLTKSGNVIFGGDGDVNYFGRIFGDGQVTVHFEMHRHGDAAHPLIGTVAEETFELDGFVGTGLISLSGSGDHGERLSVNLRRLG